MLENERPERRIVSDGTASLNTEQRRINRCAAAGWWGVRNTEWIRQEVGP